MAPLNSIYLQDVSRTSATLIREWLNTNAVSRWNLLYGDGSVRLTFEDESEMIHFMLAKSSLLS